MRNTKVIWTCRVHPTDSFHEVGCPHRDWSKEELYEALETAKKTIEAHISVFKDHPEIVSKISQYL